MESVFFALALVILTTTTAVWLNAHHARLERHHRGRSSAPPNEPDSLVLRLAGERGSIQNMRTRIAFLVVAVLLVAFTFTPNLHAQLLTGSIVARGESVGPLSWGDGTNNLFHDWSVQLYDSGGFAYGSNYGWSNADVFVYQSLNDPTAIADASGFAYTSAFSVFSEGDTVFFRGLNGFYGAWRVDDVFRNTDYAGLGPVSFLNGQWYFQSDGSANFTAVPEPSTFALLLMTGAGALWWARRQR